jgi:hypothetical protein
MLPEKVMELLDRLDQQIRSLETARALAKLQVRPDLPALALTGLRHLLAGEGQEAASVFETLAEEIHERTVSL